MSDPTITWDQFDDEGNWIGTCPTCGTDHGGQFPPGTLGGEVACLNVQVSRLNGPGAWLLRRRLRRFRARFDGVRDEMVRRYLES